MVEALNRQCESDTVVGLRLLHKGERMNVKRYAMVRGLGATSELVARYLPSNYEVIGTGTVAEPWGEESVVVIGGRDSHGWTLDSYVIPRLGSGCMQADEIDLSHPVMMQLPA